MSQRFARNRRSPHVGVQRFRVPDFIGELGPRRMVKHSADRRWQCTVKELCGVCCCHDGRLRRAAMSVLAQGVPQAAVAPSFDVPATYRGKAGNYAVYYETALAKTGVSVADAVIATCERDDNAMLAWFRGKPCLRRCGSPWRRCSKPTAGVNIAKRLPPSRRNHPCCSSRSHPLYSLRFARIAWAQMTRKQRCQSRPMWETTNFLDE
jgi:hypothetical protein